MTQLVVDSPNELPHYLLQFKKALSLLRCHSIFDDIQVEELEKDSFSLKIIIITVMFLRMKIGSFSRIACYSPSKSCHSF